MNNDSTTHAPFNDDPRLTAYALGELDSRDASELARQLAADPALRREIDAIRATAGSLRAGFAAEPVATLTSGQRDAILRRLAHAEPVLDSPRFFVLRSRWVGASLAAAAVIGLTVTAAIMLRPDTANDSDFARAQQGQPAGAGGSGVQNERGRRGDLGNEQAPGERLLAAGGIDAERDKSTLSDALGKKDHDLAGTVAPALLPATKEKQDLVQRQAGGGAADGLTAGAPAEPRPATPLQSPPAPSAQPAVSGGAAGGGGGSEPGWRGGDGAAHAPSDRSNGAPRIDPGSQLVPAKPAATPPTEAPQGRAHEVATPDSSAAATSPQAETPAGDAGTGTAGGLRRPARDDQADDAAETKPRLFSEDEIAQLEEGEVRAALQETGDQRASAATAQTRKQLDKQLERLGSRLKAIEQQTAEEYSRINDNPFIKPVGASALSTFSVDVDTASYSNVRRFLTSGQLPPADAVRIEEMVNYFRYDYAPPTAADGDAPFKASVEIAAAPWNPEHRLVRIGLRGKEERMDMRRATSLVLLVDVSGSMNEPDKLPLVKASLKKLVAQLNGDDRLAIVTYQGNAGLALDSCYVNAENREKIDAAIATMQPGGSTNGAGGINLAYDLARQNFIKDGINRVLLCTDGDFNVGVSGDDALVALIEEQRKSNVFLSVLGFGTGNFKDAKMEKLSNAGNGNFAYIDSLAEAHKVLVEQMGGTLVTIAKDVKFQIEFNPAKVGAYRLIGYEDRLLAAEDFNNDAKDAGEIGSGHTVTALYEIVPVGKEADALAMNPEQGEVDELIYQKPATPAGDAAVPMASSGDLLMLKMRYKQPEGDKSDLLSFPIKDLGNALDDASADFRFAAAVAEFGMLLRRSPYRSGATFDHVFVLAQGALGEDQQGYREQFLELIRKARTIESGQSDKSPVP